MPKPAARGRRRPDSTGSPRGRASSVEEGDHPVAQQPRRHGRDIVAILLAKALLPGLLAHGADEVLVAVDRARDLEARRAEQPDVLAHRPVDRDHDLGAEQAVRAGLAFGRIVDVVAEIVAVADLHLAELERGVRHLGIDHRQPVGHHRAAADVAQERVVVPLVGAEVGARSARPCSGYSRPASDSGRCTSCRRTGCCRAANCWRPTRCLRTEVERRRARRSCPAAGTG